MKECNSIIRQLKQQYEDKENELSNKKFRSMDVSTHDEEAGGDERTAGLMKQKRMLEEGRRHLGDGKEHAARIGSELERQKEKLSKSLNTV